MKVKSESKAEFAGLKHGDWIMEVNGHAIRDMPHNEVVELIRQSSENEQQLHLTVVSQESSIEEENGTKVE